MSGSLLVGGLLTSTLDAVVSVCVCVWFEMMFAVLRGTVCTVIFLLDFTEVTLHDTTGRDRHRSLTVSSRSLECFKCCCCVYTVE